MGPSPPALLTARRGWRGHRAAGQGGSWPCLQRLCVLGEVAAHLCSQSRPRGRAPFTEHSCAHSPQTRASARPITWKWRLQSGMLSWPWRPEVPQATCPRLGAESSRHGCPGLEGSRPGGPQGWSRGSGRGHPGRGGRLTGQLGPSVPQLLLPRRFHPMGSPGLWAPGTLTVIWARDDGLEGP